jgi:hypothetical protein
VVAAQAALAAELLEVVPMVDLDTVQAAEAAAVVVEDKQIITLMLKEQLLVELVELELVEVILLEEMAAAVLAADL